jgi:hypothetical protein
MIIKIITKKTYMDKKLFLIIIVVLTLLISLEAVYSNEVLSEDSYDYEDFFMTQDRNVERVFFLVGDVKMGEWHI